MKLRARAQLASLKPGAAEILLHLGAPVLLIDGVGGIEQANAAAEEYFGASAGVLATRGLPAPLAALVARPGEVLAHDLGLEVGDRELRADVTLMPVGRWPGWRVMLIAPRADAQAPVDSAAITTVAAQLAHEIKNPLGGIRGAAQLLGADVGPEGRELTQLIQTEVDRVTRLVERLERLADERPLAAEPVNLHEVLQHVCRLTRGFAPGLLVREVYDPSLPDVLGDREALIQLFLNLVKNAAEAIGIKGEILLTTAYRHGNRIAGRKLPIVVGVSDNGPGLTQHVSQRLFQPLVTTKPSGGGLGLALVAKIAASHGGAVSHTREGDRTIFRVALAPAP
jgi:two-component system nitrogen regulation sensor histidine kinase GlnL